MRWFLGSGLPWMVLALLITGFLWFVPQRQVEYLSQQVPAEDRPALVNEYRRTWAQIIGGFGLLLGLYFTWRRVEISQDQQVTERFTRAIDQLGATDDKTGEPRREVRLGGIYALERIARDSPTRDYPTVMEVLTTYVRERAPRVFGQSEGASFDVQATAEADEGAEQPAPPVPRRPTADIQAILDVLGRAPAYIPRGYFRRLNHRHLRDNAQAYEPWKYLPPLNLRETNLQGANLQEADFQRAAFERADLSRALLDLADLSGANLQRAILFKAQLFIAKLPLANLEGANLQEANLEGANLQRAILQDANLKKASLEVSNLQGATLYGADLQGADLSGANLQRAILHDANLEGANLQGAQVTDEQLEKAETLAGATMPDGQILKGGYEGFGDEAPNGPTFEEWRKDK
jgi:uncharacterized protein YjbI with pentapeptide repeats